MSLPILAEVGRATADPELRFAASGTAVVKLSLAFNSRKKDQATGQWADDKVMYVEATAFKQLAENIAESITRGMEVVAIGRLQTEQWEDKQSGQKRSKVTLILDALGPNLSFATARVQKMSRSSGEGGSRPAQGGGDADPWASQGAERSSGFGGKQASSLDDEPPF